MRSLPRFAAVSLVVLAACSGSSSSGGGGGGGGSVRLGDASTIGATVQAGNEAATCPAGSAACGTSGWCCPTATVCAQNPSNVLGCGAGAEYCCLGCSAGAPCGGGCCAGGTSCVGNPGDATACGTALCCAPAADEACPVDVAAQCATGT